MADLRDARDEPAQVPSVPVHEPGVGISCGLEIDEILPGAIVDRQLIRTL
jgi:hypothetical protein